MIKLSVGSEVLSVSIQGEVDIATVALNHHYVPVVVIQETASGHGGVPQDGAVLVTACKKHSDVRVMKCHRGL